MQPTDEHLGGADATAHFGFKRITLENWKQMDEVIQFPSPISEAQWVKACLDTQLGASIPEKVAALFEVARGSMVYGWFFYPVISLATEQCFRVLEAGARAKWEQLTLPTQQQTSNGSTRDLGFSALINSLEKAGCIDQHLRRRWEAIRGLRNSASHPKRQSIHSPGEALNILAVTAEMLHRFFPDPKTVAATLPDSFPG